MTPNTIHVSLFGEEIDVPTTFEHQDFAKIIGDVPERVEVDRIFEFDGVIRASVRLDDGSVVEIANFTQDDFRDGNPTGWVANRIFNPSSVKDGVTIWVRGEDEIPLPN